MNEVVTYIRCQINGKWTNLGLIAEEDEIQEHFEFVEGLLKEKQRADELEKRWSELRDTIKSDLAEAEGYEDHNKAMDLIEVLDKMHDLEENNNA